MTSPSGRTPGVGHFTGAQLLRTLHLFARDPDLADLVDLGARFRQRRRLADTPQLQIWLMSWPVGASTGWHDHGGSTGAHLLVRGELWEQSWFGGVHERLVSHEGEVLPGNHVHDVVNVGDEVALSLHAYAPALPVTGRYVLRDGQLAAA